VILSLNTSTAQFSMALMEEDENLVAEFFMASGSRHFRPFMPVLHELLTISKRGLGEIKAVAVATGPGSFTGLRVGLAAAKGICEGLSVPIVGVSSLEAMANQLPFAPHPVCAILDSRKGEVFAALFRWSNESGMVRLTDDLCLRVVDLASVTDERAIYLGNNRAVQGAVISKVLGDRALLAPPSLWHLKASAVGRLGLRQAGERGFDNLEDLVPSYLRPPDIRPNPYQPPSEIKGQPR
jgi:tRNA threonylcarbamoyladenosine biosynthesis protein TsaB